MTVPTATLFPVDLPPERVGVGLRGQAANWKLVAFDFGSFLPFSHVATLLQIIDLVGSVG